jgi:hypothetical protein
MSDPQIVCPKCSTPIKLTDTLAAPLIAKTRRQFEQQMAQKDADFAKREVSLRKSQKALAKARDAIDDEVAKRLQLERVSITESEKKKARIALAADLKQRDVKVALKLRQQPRQQCKISRSSTGAGRRPTQVPRTRRRKTRNRPFRAEESAGIACRGSRQGQSRG